VPLFAQSLKPESENDMPTSTDSVEPNELPRHSIGALLRETRRGLGGDVDKIAATLRIRASYLRAIEESQYDQLPAQVYALGFVRAYANHLGLDGEEAVRRFKQETVDFEPPRGLSFPVPLAERSIPGGTMVLAALILALCGYGLWYYVSTGERARPERVAAVPADLAPPPPPAAAPAAAPAVANASPAATQSETPASGSQPAAGAAPPPQSQTAAAPPASPRPVLGAEAVPPSAAPASSAAPSSPSAPAAATAAGEANTVASASPSAPAAAAPASTASGADEARVFGAVGETSRIVINVQKDSWIQIHAGDRILIDKLLHPGDSYRVGDRSGLVMRTGNAAGLDIRVDGRKVPPIQGTVRHQILLDPNRLLAGTASAD
jgi:cytoskeleton protein RodZ